MRAMGIPQRNVIPLTRRAKHGRHTRWGSAVARLDARVAELERHMGEFDRRIAVLGKHARMHVAFAWSVLVHAVVIFGVTFTLPDASKFTPQPTLEITLVNAKTTARPKKADVLAQSNLDGGGNTDEARRARTPLPVPKAATPATELTMAQKRVQQLERDAKQLMTQAQSSAAVRVEPEAPKPQAEEQAGPSIADMRTNRMEIARLNAQIKMDMD